MSQARPQKGGPQVRSLQLRHLLANPITDGPHETPEFLDTGVPFLSVDNVQDDRLSFVGCRYIDPALHREYTRKSRILRGDVLVTKAASIGKVAVVEVDFEFGVWSPIAILRPREGLDSRFLAYTLRALSTQHQLQLLCTKNTQQNISMGDLASMLVPQPPTQERQHWIADFLDQETSRIDAVLSALARLEFLVAEHSAATTQRLVCGTAQSTYEASQPSVFLPPFNPHWPVVSLRRLPCSVQTGPFGSLLHADEYIENGTPVINPINLVEGTIRADYSVSVDQGTANRLSRYALRTGDVVFARRGELGRAALVNADNDGWLCGTGLLRVRFDRPVFESRYLHYYLSAVTRAYFEAHAVGSTMGNLSTQLLMDMPLPLPPIDEQSAIADRCDQVRERAHMTTRLMSSQKALLKERRSALITTAISGQLDAAPEAA